MYKFIQSISVPAADTKERSVRIERPVIGRYTGHIKIKIRKHIRFIKYKTIGVSKHQRIFFYFVIALRYTKQSDPQRFADIEFGRTYQITYIFYKDHIQVIQRKTREDMLDTHCLDMAGTVCIQLYGRHSKSGDTFRVYLPCDVSFDDADFP